MFFCLKPLSRPAFRLLPVVGFLFVVLLGVVTLSLRNGAWIEKGLYPFMPLATIFFGITVSFFLLWRTPFCIEKNLIFRFLVKFKKSLDSYNEWRFILILFIFAILIKSFYMHFDFSTQFYSAKPFADAIYFKGDYFSDIDDYPLYTILVVGFYKLFGPNCYAIVILFNVFLGSLTSLVVYGIFRTVFSKTVCFLISFLVIIYAPFTIWESAARYDTLFNFSVMLFILAFLLISLKPSKMKTVFFGICSIFTALNKEFIVYFVPLFVITHIAIRVFLFHDRLKWLIIKGIVIILITVGAVSYKGNINKQHFGISSWKKDFCLFVNIMLYEILNTSTATKNESLKYQILAEYDRLISDVSPSNHPYLSADFVDRAHKLPYTFLMQRNEKGIYFQFASMSPFLHDIAIKHFPVYAKKSIAKFLLISGGSGFPWDYPYFSRIKSTVSDHLPLKLIHMFWHGFMRIYWLYSIVLVYLIFAFESCLIKKTIMLFFCLFPLLYGLFLSFASAAEFWRTMLPAHYFILSFVVIFGILIAKAFSTSISQNNCSKLN